jgi:hypothetical protein
MSLMSWLFSSPKRSRSGPAAMPGAAQSRKGAHDAGASARRKAERAGRREMLYAVVREAMVRAGVLSASYKFKVLSLDTDGHQFLIMVDLASGAGGDARNLAEIEALIAQSAKSRHEILVTAVYWRVNEHVAVRRADPHRRPRGADSRPMQDSRPMPLDSQPAPMHSAPAPLMVTPPSRGPAYDPIQADEVEAFKKALVAGSRPAPLAAATADGKAAGAAAKHHGPRSFTLLTGYEDTEMPENEQKPPLLSGTQYGELR